MMPTEAAVSGHATNPTGGAATPADLPRVLRQGLRTITESSSLSRLLTMAFWSATGEALSRGSVLLSTILLARILSPQQYGEFSIVRSTINLLVTVGGAGLGLTANRYVAQFRQSRKRDAGELIGSSYILAIASGLLTGVALIAAAGPVASTIRAPHLHGGLRTAGLVLCFSAINAAQFGIMQGLEAYRQLAAANACLGLLAFASILAGAYYFGVDGAIGALVLNAILSVCVLYKLIRRECRAQAIPTNCRNLGSTMPIVWNFSVPVALMGITVAPFKWLTDILLARTAGMYETAVFQAGLTIATLLIALLSTLNAPLITACAGGSAGGARDKMQYLTLYAPWYLFAGLATPLLLYPRLLSWPFGAAYDTRAFYSVAVLLLVYSGMLLLYQGITRLAVQNGSVWPIAVTNFVEGCALLTAFYAPNGRSAESLSLAYVASYAARFLVSIPLLRRAGILPAHVLCDRYFILSAAAIASIAAFQLLRLR